MSFAICVETIMDHRRTAIRTWRRIDHPKNAVGGEFKVVREIIQDR
jgi:hypothetical protein